MVLATMVMGCARGASPGGTTPAAAAEDDARVAMLEAEARRHAEERRELETQLALARARAATPRTETVRIGGDERAVESDEGLLFFEADGTSWDEPPAEVPAELVAEEEPEDDGPRPVLRLHEAAPFVLSDETVALPALPEGPTPSALPARVAAGGWRTLPSGPATSPAPTSPAPSTQPASIPVSVTPSAPAPFAMRAPAPAADASVEEYTRALGLLRERRVADALRAFDTFLADHGDHPMAASARYWRAESLYVLRRYGEAQAAFDAYLVAHPRDGRAPDALLKLGLCHEHMGDAAAAFRTFERLRREHPSSVAARLASREDA